MTSIGDKISCTVLKGLCDVLPTSKGENEAFPPPTSPSNVVPLYKLERGDSQIVLFSEITHLRIVSHQFCHRLWVM